MAWTSLCQIDELREDFGKYVEIDGFQLAVFLHKAKVYVMDNTCPHAGGDLSGGMLDDGCAVCPWHSWNFKLEDGQMPGQPQISVRVYPTRLFAREGQADLVQADLPIY